MVFDSGMENCHWSSLSRTQRAETQDLGKTRLPVLLSMAHDDAERKNSAESGLYKNKEVFQSRLASNLVAQNNWQMQS